MGTVVSITSNARIAVLSQIVVDGGRELKPNGLRHVQAGQTRDFIVDEHEVLTVAAAPEPPPEEAGDAEAAAPAAAPATDKVTP